MMSNYNTHSSTYQQMYDYMYDHFTGRQARGLMMDGLGHGMMRNVGNQKLFARMFAWMTRGRTQPSERHAVSIQRARQYVRRYINHIGVKNLVLDELIEFQRNFYAVVNDRGTGHGAFEVLVNKSTGAVFPEFGPDMMWNTQYGMMTGWMGGMMGYSKPSGPMTVSPSQAHRLALSWLRDNRPGATLEMLHQFPGYYTIHFDRNGKVAGMFSINGYTGQVWYHSWHGKALRVVEG
jgi:hypothetical protein